MKRNWMQIITLLLCAVLLCVVIEQSVRINALQRKMENELDDLTRHVEYTADRIVNSVDARFEEASRLVADYALEPIAINKDSHSLGANVSVQLKEWHDDTTLTLLAALDEETLTLPMTAGESGKFNVQLEIPLENDIEVILDVIISGGGLTKQESLGAWGELGLFLPLRNGGGGWSLPFYEECVMRGQFHFAVDGEDAVPEGVSGTAFDIYKNGKLVETINAVEDPYASSSNGICYTTDTENYEWQLKCEVGDVIDIRFRCVDEYGLGYDFMFVTWRADGTDQENQAGVKTMTDMPHLVLYWPE